MFSICRIPETWRHVDGHLEVETWKLWDIDMRRGNMEKWIHEDMDNIGHEDMEIEIRT
jgi:hypothetical protein